VPETRDASVSSIADRRGPAECAWKYFLPHLVLESTGRLNPQLMPAVYYATPGQNRDEIRRRSLGSMATFHALISKSPLFHSIKSEAQPTSTVNTPGHRLTDFYVHSTQLFTDSYLDKTGTVAFNWVQLQPLDEVVAKTPSSLQVGNVVSPSFFAIPPTAATPADPLFDKADVLCRESIEKMQRRFVASAGAANQKPVAALNVRSHERELQALALGAAVGESAVKTVDPGKYTLGVDLELRIADRPYAPNVALVPVGAMLPIEARVLASQMRHMTPNESPSSVLSMFNTADNVEFVRQSTQNEDVADGHAMARLCDNAKLVGEQRARVTAIEKAVTAMFADRPWVDSDNQGSLHLHTFFFRPHDLVNDDGVHGVPAELKRFRDDGLVHTARFYVEAPTKNFKYAVIQVLCKEPANIDDELANE